MRHYQIILRTIVWSGVALGVGLGILLSYIAIGVFVVWSILHFFLRLV